MLNKDDVLVAVKNLMTKLGRGDAYNAGQVSSLLDLFVKNTEGHEVEFLSYTYIFLNRFLQALEEKPWETSDVASVQASNLLSDPEFTDFDDKAQNKVDSLRDAARLKFDEVYKKTVHGKAAQSKNANQSSLEESSGANISSTHKAFLRLSKSYAVNTFIHKLRTIDAHDLDLLLAIIFNTARTAAVPEYSEISLKSVMKKLDGRLRDPDTKEAAWQYVLFLQGGFFTAIGGNIHVSREEFAMLNNQNIVDAEHKTKDLTAEEKELLRAEREGHISKAKHAWQMMPLKQVEDIATNNIHKNAVYSQVIKDFAGATIQEQARKELLRRQAKAAKSEHEYRSKRNILTEESKPVAANPVAATPAATAKAAKPARRKSIREILASFFYTQKKKNMAAGNITSLTTLSSGSVSTNSDTTKPAEQVKRRLRRYDTPAKPKPKKTP